MAPLKPYFTGAEKPPRTRVTTFLEILLINSAIARPASTSPPTVLSIIRTPYISSFSSIEYSIGIICSYLVDFF